MIPALSDPSPLPPLFGKPRALAIAAGVLLAATLTVFGDLLLAGGGRILSMPGTDLSGVFVGWCEFTVREMAGEHNLPLWNPHLFSGAPCLGGFQWSLLYPSTWLLLIMPLPQAINWGIALHVFLAGLFTYMWMARRGVHPAAAVVSGFAFMFGGGYFMHITAGHLPNLRTMVWAPLIFLAIDDITTTRSLRGAWLGAAAVMMQILAGHPQYTYYNALIAGPYALLAVWRAPSRRHALVGLALMGFGAVAMSAIQLFTGLQAAQESIRSGLRIEVASTFPFPPENLLTLTLPGFFGQPSDHMYWGRWLLWEDSLFIGAAALALAFYGLIRGDRRLQPLTILGFLVASLIIAFGKYTPLYGFLYRHLPGFSSFRGVSKVAFIGAIFLANLVGVGFDALLREKRISRAPSIIIASVAIILLGIGALIWISGKAGPDGRWAHALLGIKWFAEAYPKSIVAGPTFFTKSAQIAARMMFWCAGVCMVLSVFWFCARRWRACIYGIAGLVALDLLIFAFQNRPTFDLAAVEGQEAQMRSNLDLLPPDARVVTSVPSVVLGAGGNEGWGNDPMVLRRYAEFMDIDQDIPADELMQKGFSRPTGTWGLFRVHVPMVFKGQMRWVATEPQLGRAQLIENARVIEDPKALLATIARRQFDPRREVLLEKSVVFPPASSMPSSADQPGVVSLKDRSTDEIEITAEIARPCILLLSDTYSAGWRVVPLDEHAAQKYEVIPADYALRAIPLLPGSHHFILEYLPTAWIAGKWVTCVSLILWALAALKLWGKPKEKQG